MLKLQQMYFCRNTTIEIHDQFNRIGHIVNIECTMCPYVVHFK